MGWPDLSWLGTSEEERVKMQLLRETDSLAVGNLVASVFWSFPQYWYNIPIEKFAGKTGQGQEETRFETWRKVFFIRTFMGRGWTSDNGDENYNGALDNDGGGDYDVECEDDIRCGELVSDSIHIQ